ncbi:ATP-binding protein [Desulfopila aestuarii]|nr:ATP-binding protein [Desulfopila aestuarii]
MEHQPEGTLLIDLGTNGELLFKDKKTLFAASCATGPAFEGATLSCGIQAIPGAINKASIINDVDFPEYTTVNFSGSKNIKPCGVCGTGVISSVAELCRHGIIEPSGAFTKKDTIRPLVQDNDNRLKYILLPEDETHDERAISISQQDVRSVQLGKAAIITGIEFLLKAAGYDHPNKIIIAGAFGTFMEMEDMVTLGMIPTIATEQIEIVGNSAGAGAVMALCDNTYLQKAIEMASQVVTIDLTCDIQFQKIFVQKLRFPHFKNDNEPSRVQV